MEKVSLNRTDSVRVKFAPSMMERVESLASDYGMPSATFCAFAVASFVCQQENAKKHVAGALSEMVKQTMGVFTDEKMEKIFGPMFAGVLKEQLLEPSVCTCTITEHERQEDRNCPVHFPKVAA